MKIKQNWAAAAGLGLSALAACSIYAHRIWAEADLSRLEAYAATQSYARLIERSRQDRPGAERFRFAVVGGTRRDMQASRSLLAAAASEEPGFILHTGDLVDTGHVPEYASRHMELVLSLRGLPLIPAPGDRDAGPGASFAAFRALYGGDRFSFDYGDCRFIGFTCVDGEGVSREAFAWLRRELTREGAYHKFVLLHAAPANVAREIDSAEPGFRRRQKEFAGLLSAAGAQTVYFGAGQGLATHSSGGVRYALCGDGAPGYILVDVTPDAVRQYAVTKEGEGWRRRRLE